MVRFVIITLSLAAFGLSLAFPAIVVDPPEDSYWGGICLLIGWVSVLEFWPMWLANPLLLLCLIFLGCKKYRVALVLGLAAIAFALCTLSITQMLRDEGGTMNKVTGFGVGFYLWLLSIVIPTVGSLIMVLERKQPPD